MIGQQWSADYPVLATEEARYRATHKPAAPGKDAIEKIITQARTLFLQFCENPNSETRNELTRTFLNIPQGKRKKLGYALKDLRAITQAIHNERKKKKEKQENIETYRIPVRFKNPGVSYRRA